MTEAELTELRSRIAEIDEVAREQVDLAVNAAMVRAYWRIGRALADISSPEALRELAVQLCRRLRKAVTVNRLAQMKLFYGEYPNGSALCAAGDSFPPELSFSQYLVPRFEDVPKLEIHLLDRPDLPPVGAGETPIIAVAPAIANAIGRGTGRRVREMPIRLARA